MLKLLGCGMLGEGVQERTLAGLPQELKTIV